MKLNQAIQHCKERVDNTLCGYQHKQLQEWLEELQYYRSLEKKGWLVDTSDIANCMRLITNPEQVKDVKENLIAAIEDSAEARLAELEGTE